MSRIDFVPEMAEPCRPLSQRRLAAYRPLTPAQEDRILENVLRSRCPADPSPIPFTERERRSKIADRIGTFCGFLVVALVCFLVGVEAGVWE